MCLCVGFMHTLSPPPQCPGEGSSSYQRILELHRFSNRLRLRSVCSNFTLICHHVCQHRSCVARTWGEQWPICLSVDDGDWSTEKSCVCTWNLDRRGLNPKRPDTVIDVARPVMSLSFHPSQPSLIAGMHFYVASASGLITNWSKYINTTVLCSSLLTSLTIYPTPQGVFTVER